jgi:site-specific recombinase XerD
MTEWWQVNPPSGSGRSTASVHRIVTGQLLRVGPAVRPATSEIRSGIALKLAQTLARHSDINLTMQVYSHVELEDQNAAIAALPGPPRG